MSGYLDLDKITHFQNGLVIGEALHEISIGEPITFDGMVSAVTGVFESDIDMDSVLEEFDDGICSDIALFLDHIGVDERVVNDLMCDDNAISMDSMASIAKTFTENFDASSLGDVAMSFATGIDFDAATIKRKVGYKPQLVIRNGKKKWVNKRISGKKVILTPAQKRGLIKARLKANTGASKRKREMSRKRSKSFKLS